MAKRSPLAAITSAAERPIALEDQELSSAVLPVQERAAASAEASAAEPENSETPAQPASEALEAPEASLSTVHRTRSTVKGTRWEDLNERYTFHANKAMLKELRALSKHTGESLTSLVNRACRELLAREGLKSNR